MNALLYFSVVLIWGTTWIAISVQQHDFSPIIGVFWRFLIAAMILFVMLIPTKHLKKLNLTDHLFCGLQGMCVFGLNFICFYTAVKYINSGLESVIFSMAVIFNMLNAKFFFKQPISTSFIPAAILGLLGIIALFWHDLQATTFHQNSLLGIGLCLLGTFGFSLGNMISLRHQNHQKDVFTTNAYGMLYGAIMMGIVGLFLQKNFVPEVSLTALSALFYLAIIGSVVGFSLYFILVGRIGAGKVAYSTLLFPLIALGISTICENYQWHVNSIIGICLILIGNFILFSKPRWPKIIFKNYH